MSCKCCHDTEASPTHKHESAHVHEGTCGCGKGHDYEDACSCDGTCECNHDGANECSCDHKQDACSCHDNGLEERLAHGSSCCCCGDDDDDDDGEDPKVKLMRVIAASILLVVAVLIDRFIELPLVARLLLFMPSYLVAGYDVLLEAAESVIKLKPFDEDFLMSIATIGALLIGFVPGGSPEFAEAVFVMLFFQVGELFEGYAEGNSRRSIAQLMDIRPDTANLEHGDHVVEVHPSQVAPGSIIVLKPGERVPLDAEVIEGTSSVNTVALTGESAPRAVAVGDALISGTVNIDGVLRARTTKTFGDSTATRILELVEHASSNKSRSESFIRRFARVYTPAVVAAAIAVALLPPLFSGNFGANFATWLLRALTFLVVSCPCALVISVPLSFFGGIGAASKHGVLIKGSNYLEALAHAKTIVFDKTGTLTQGSFKVVAVHPQNAQTADKNALLHLAAHVEQLSTHPIAAALRDVYPDATTDACTVTDVQEIAGQGIIANVGGQPVAVGNTALMERVGAAWQPCEHTGTIVHVAQNSTYLGHIVISDEVKPTSAQAISALHAAGVAHTVMLTGDTSDVAAAVAQQVGVDSFEAGLLPQQKVEHVEALLATTQTADKNKGSATLAFVGDGINDAPVLARADVGIAMGAMGSDAAIEAADVVLMDDNPEKIATAMQVARRTVRIAHQNVVFAIAVKLIILLLAALGLAPMWLAVFGDVGVMVLCVLNATRVLRA